MLSYNNQTWTMFNKIGVDYDVYNVYIVHIGNQAGKGKTQ